MVNVQEHRSRGDDLPDPPRSRLTLRSARKVIFSSELPRSPMGRNPLWTLLSCFCTADSLPYAPAPTPRWANPNHATAKPPAPDSWPPPSTPTPYPDGSTDGPPRTCKPYQLLTHAAEHLTGVRPRAAALALTHLARAHQAYGNPDQAAKLTTRAEHLATGLRSSRVNRDLAALHSQAADSSVSPR